MELLGFCGLGNINFLACKCNFFAALVAFYKVKE
jgi:hypothetical protein